MKHKECKTMDYPEISERFDVKDIRKIREYEAERHSKMSHQEIVNEIRKETDEAIKQWGL